MSSVGGDVAMRQCRICLATEAEERDLRLVSPCACKGTMQYVHETCLLRWVDELESKPSESSRSPLICPQCGKRYAITTPRRGIFLSLGKLCGRFCSEATPVMAMFGFCMCLWSGLALYGGLVYSTTCQIPLRTMMTYNSPKRLFGLLPFIPLTLIGAHTIAQVRLHITISTHGVWNIHVMSAAAAANVQHQQQQQEQLQQEEEDEERDMQQRGRHRRPLLRTASRSRSSSRDHPRMQQHQQHQQHQHSAVHSHDGTAQRHRHHFGQRHHSEHRSAVDDPRHDERVLQRLRQLRQLEQRRLRQHGDDGHTGTPTYFEERDHSAGSGAQGEVDGSSRLVSINSQNNTADSQAPSLANGHSEWSHGHTFPPHHQPQGHYGGDDFDERDEAEGTPAEGMGLGSARAGFGEHGGYTDTEEDDGDVYAYSSDDGEFMGRYMRGDERDERGEDEDEGRDLALAYDMLEEWADEGDEDEDGGDAVMPPEGDLLMEMEDEMHPNHQLRPFDFLQIVIGSLTLPFISTLFGRLLFSKPSRHPLESVFLGGFVYEVAKAVLVSEYSRQKRHAQSGRIVRNVTQ